MSIFALNLITGLGLGLAIDYSLFMVSRFREELPKRGPGDGAAATMATAGRTVLFSSLTVAAALASLLVFPQRFLYSMGVGGSSGAARGAVALIVLPAILGALGERVNALRPKLPEARAERRRGRRERVLVPALALVMRRPTADRHGGRPLLIVLGIPFLRIEFTAVDARCCRATRAPA